MFLEFTVAQNSHCSELICYPSTFNLPRLLLFIKSFRIVWSFCLLRYEKEFNPLIDMQGKKQIAKQEIGQYLGSLRQHHIPLSAQLSSRHIYARDAC